MSETSPRPMGEQVRSSWTVADVLSVARVPMAIAFVLIANEWWRLGIVALAGLTDLLDGRIARRYGSSRAGPIVDPIADKLFMACAFGVVAFSGRLEWYEIVGVLIRDIIATVAFFATAIFGHAVAVPARLGGKAGKRVLHAQDALLGLCRLGFRMRQQLGRVHLVALVPEM